jgi:hypothetical protein
MVIDQCRYSIAVINQWTFSRASTRPASPATSAATERPHLIHSCSCNCPSLASLLALRLPLPL